jgi:hypothetical protein
MDLTYFAFPWVGNNKKFPHNPTVGKFDIVTMDNNNITFKFLIAILQNWYYLVENDRNMINLLYNNDILKVLVHSHCINGLFDWAA